MASQPSVKSDENSPVRDLSLVSLTEAFKIITGGALGEPNELQQALFPRLLTSDTGLLIPTGPAAGRLEAVVIPSLLGMRLDAAAHRLFIVGPDDRPLDDYSYRLSSYVRNLVMADSIERTLWLEEPDRPPIARTYFADGSVQNGVAEHPFSESVDIVAMPFSHFRATFFGSGGVHAMPEASGLDTGDDYLSTPRGLIYFDDAFGPTQDERIEFVKFVQFLFAQDLDVVVGSSSLPLTMRDDLVSLELVDVKSAQTQPKRSIEYIDSLGANLDETMERLVLRDYGHNARVAVVFNDIGDSRTETLHARLLEEYPDEVYLYSSAASRSQRRLVYAHLRELERENEGYIVITDGPALEVSDLDTTHIVSQACDPLSLVRRAGHCDRRGTSPGALISIIGQKIDTGIDSGSVSPADVKRRDKLTSALTALGSRTDYDPLVWEGFLD